MKFAIAGSGGTGGVLGAYLAKAGNDVTFLARGKHLEAIREKGLTLESQHNGNFTVYPVKACRMDEYADRPDVLLVCVKYYDIEAAIELARRTAGEDTIVLPILNVYGTGGVMQDALPENLTVLDGCMYVFGMIKEPGVISQPQSILRVFYGFRQGQDRRLEAKARDLEQVFKAAGIDGHFTDNIAADHLQKF
ncbi:MAG: NAD(P)-binding domain-containing protein, partial [Selenomonadaceae bacterium]|nr:NAD(P)-binding domain-containing protein [Selenomonadaceae bacterium]